MYDKLHSVHSVDRLLWWLLPILIVVLTLWGFVKISEAVLADEWREFDEAVLLSLRESHDPGDPIGPHWVEEGVRDITALGSVVILSMLTLATAGYLLLCRQGASAIYTILAVGGAGLMTELLKRGFGRPRPDLVAHGMETFSLSFPSGHTMVAAATYLTLGAMLARSLSSRSLRIYVVALAGILSMLVGCSRVYLGVHWPTDVLAGWALGIGWASAIWLLARWLERHGTIEHEEEPVEA